MGALPYLKFYPGDWLSDRKVRRLSPEARGLYWDLLCVAWQEGGISTDTEELAQDAAQWGFTRKRFDKAWSEVERFWVHGRNGELVNPRQERERAKAIEVYEQRVAAGKKGGRPKQTESDDETVRKANG